MQVVNQIIHKWNVILLRLAHLQISIEDDEGDNDIGFEFLHDLDPYLTHYIQIQKMRLTKVNEIPNSFIFTNHGITLMGTSLEKKLVDSSKAQKQVQGIME